MIEEDVKKRYQDLCKKWNILWNDHTNVCFPLITANIYQNSKFLNQPKNMDKHTWRRVQISSKSQSQPIPRWGHNCCVIGEQVVFFGGYADSNYMNDVWSFNTVTMGWSEIKTTGDLPSNRSNCSMNYDRENNRIVVFGGGGPNKKRFNSINILDWSTKQWIEINPKQNQNAPWERTYHAAELIFPYLIVYGGEGIADMDDLWIFNFLTLSWTEVCPDKQKPRPSARRFHSSALVGNELFIIAGCHGKYRPLNDIYSIDLTPLLETGRVDTLEWRQRKFSSSGFLTRWGQSSCVNDNKIYVFGGRFSSDLNDILVIDVEKETMKTLKTGMEAPKPRRRHSACFIGSCMLVFGGFNGQYFNDLFYVNTFELRSKLAIPANNKSILNQRFVNSEHLSDYNIFTSDLQKFPIHKGIIVNSFLSQSDMQNFLSEIDGSHTKDELNQIMSCLYQGYGSIAPKLLKNFGIQIPQTLEEKERKYKDYVNNVLLSSPKINQIIGKKSNNLNPVIPLQEQQFLEFLERQRQPQFSNLTIILNKLSQIRVNGAQLALSSTYFSNLLSGRYGDISEGKLYIALPQGNPIVFQIMLNYLLMDYVVTHKQMSCEEWMQLSRLAQMYCLGRLLSICEQQLCNKVSEQNYKQLMEFSLDLEMDILALWCADYQIKLMITKEETYEENQNECQQLKAKKEFILKIVYDMLRFDILQARLQRDRLLQSSLNKKESASTNPDEKQNYQINYNE